MKKLLIPVLILLTLILLLAGCDGFGIGGEQSAEIVNAPLFVLDGQELSVTVSNATEYFSFLDQITVSKRATWQISTDMQGLNTIPTKTVPLEEGDNIFYLLVTSGDGNNFNLYIVTVHRRPLLTVTFDTKDGTPIAAQRVEEGGYAVVPDVEPTRTAYTFRGWAFDFADPILWDTVVAAEWETIPYAITYDLAGGALDGNSNPTVYTIESEMITFAVPTRTGYNFTGWSQSAIPAGSYGDKTVTAYWSPTNYTISYTLNGGSTSNRTSYNIETATFTLSDATRLGYNFLGWTWEGQSTPVKSPTVLTGSIGDKSYTANWQEDPALAPFIYTLTATGCQITGVKNKAVTDLFVPDYVTSISAGAFSGCAALESITIPFVGAKAGVTASDTYRYPFGYIFGTSSYTGGTATTQSYYGSSWTSTTYYIPSGLKSVTVTGGNILCGAFYRCTSLTSITIPDSVTSIGEYAFYNCSKLTSITIGNGVTGIGYYAFDGCTSLTSITIPDSVTSIGYDAFQNCTILTSVTIGNSVTSIGGSAFSGCSKLTSVYITDLAKWCTISFGNDYANPLDYAHNLYLNGELVTDLVIPDSVTSIGNYAFYGCTGLTSITIPDNVTSIGKDAFSDCTNLTSATIPSFAISYISKTNLQTVIITSGTSIGDSAFSYCTSLTSITIPDSVTSIGLGAFSGCSGLESITIPFVGAIAGVTASNTYQYPFGYIFGTSSYTGGTATTQSYYGSSTSSTTSTTYYIPSGLKSVTVTGGNILYGAFYNCTSLTSITIGSGVTSIGNYAFSYCSSLESITSTSPEYPAIGNCLIEAKTGTLIAGCKNSVIPTDGIVTSIGDYAFRGCTSLTSITIPDSVTSIGNYAFRNCSSLTSITIPDGVTSIGEGVFSYCPDLESISSASPEYPAIGNCLIKAKTGTLIAGCKNSMIPDSVTSIGSYAFSGCTSLESITIPDSVTSIGEYAFSGCTSLQYNEYDNAYYLGNAVHPYLVLVKAKNTSISSCTISEQTRVIYYSAFSFCFSLTSITIPDSVTSIGERAFYHCPGLTSVTIRNSVTSIGNSAFYNCTSLTNITIPDSVTSIGSYAFCCCTSLTSITIPDSVTSIENYAFYYCTSLTSITIPNSVTSIGSAAFRECTSLTSITIPDSVTSIGEYAFYGCTKLTSVTFENTSGWYRTPTKGATSGTNMTVTNASTNATNLRSNYYDYYWYRK